MKTEFNLMGSVCVCACVLADPSVPQEKFTRTDPTFTHSHIHSHTCTNISKSQSGRLPLLSKSQDFIFRLFVTEKPTTNKPQLFRQVFKIVIFY